MKTYRTSMEEIREEYTQLASGETTKLYYNNNTSDQNIYASLNFSKGEMNDSII